MPKKQANKKLPPECFMPEIFRQLQLKGHYQSHYNKRHYICSLSNYGDTLYIGYSSVVGHILALLLINVGDNHTMNNWIDKSILRTAANNS